MGRVGLPSRRRTTLVLLALLGLSLAAAAWAILVPPPLPPRPPLPVPNGYDELVRAGKSIKSEVDGP